MQAHKYFDDYFSLSRLKDIYHISIRPKATVGIDRINRNSFENKRNKQLRIIERKVLNGTYDFTLYKQKLISKGRNEEPRVISIPTIRDKVALKALSSLLFDVFKQDINNEIVQTIVDKLKEAIEKTEYNYFIKLDIENFYPSIDHDILLTKIRRKIRKKEILNLIKSALKTRTVPYPNADIAPPKKGIPQGLSISNVLASIYLMDVDEKFDSEEDCAFFRYVDDILILTQKAKAKKIEEDLGSDIENLGLNLKDEKYKSGKISDQFEFLGYQNTKDGLTVRERSVEKLRKSIIKMISQFKYSDDSTYNHLEWALNLRITGCIYEKQKYGWLFFFSQIDDLELLFHLDWFVDKILERFGVDKSELRVKRFVKSYHEITKNLTQTSYIPNFSEYDYSKQRAILKEVFKLENVEGMREDQVDKYFSNIVFRQIRELEQDIQTFS